MALVVNIDTRPTYLGDKLMITGDYEAEGGAPTGAIEIDLSSFFSKILFAGINSAGAPIDSVISATGDQTIFEVKDIATITSDSKITVTPGITTFDAEGPGAGPAAANNPVQSGTFFAIGIRN